MGKINRLRRQIRLRLSRLDRDRAEARVAISEVEAVTLGKVRGRVQAILPKARVRAPGTWLPFILSGPLEPLGKVRPLQARTSVSVQQKGRGRLLKVPAGCSRSLSRFSRIGHPEDMANGPVKRQFLTPLRFDRCEGLMSQLERALWKKRSLPCETARPSRPGCRSH
jgi:hypothetical protein